MTVALLTAVFDGYDELKDLPAQDVEVETICVTDDPNLSSGSWKCVHEPRGEKHPNLAAKHPKCRPWDFTDADWVVWLDASFRVTSWSMVRELLEYGPLGMFVHPDRDCLFDEARFSAELAKYATEPLAAQTAAYQAHPEHWGLWATGLIVRQRTPQIEAFGAQWLDECERWSFQDQVSQPFVLREHGLRPVTIPGGYFANPWVRFEGSNRH